MRNSRKWTRGARAKSRIGAVLGAVLGAALVVGVRSGAAAPAPTRREVLSANKRTVQRYMEGFRRSDHAAILACLTDDVEWVIPGAVHLRGKKAFDGEIENEAFDGRPTIQVTRLTEEKNVVIAEGSVRSRRKDGGNLNLVFCDVFLMRDAKIRHLTSYLVELKP